MFFLKRKKKSDHKKGRYQLQYLRHCFISLEVKTQFQKSKKWVSQVTCIEGSFWTNFFMSRTVFASCRSSNCAEIFRAFLLKVGPTALKFKPLISEQRSSHEERDICSVSPEPSPTISENFSAGSRTELCCIPNSSSINPGDKIYIIIIITVNS